MNPTSRRHSRFGSACVPPAGEGPPPGNAGVPPAGKGPRPQDAPLPGNPAIRESEAGWRIILCRFVEDFIGKGLRANRDGRPRTTGKGGW